MELTIESIRPGDHERRHALLRQAFGSTAVYDPDAPQLDPEQVVCAYDGDSLMGLVVTLDFAMTWGGRPVPCGGVSGVVVAPEARGRGAARRMLAESFERMAARGQPISALYPTTATLYRSVGYEVVGWFGQRRLPLGSIPTAPADELRWRAVELDDPVKLTLHDEMASRHDGWFRADPRWWSMAARRAGREPGVNRFAYVGRRGGTDVAVVQYRYASSEVDLYDLDVELLAGSDGDAVAAALGFLASHGTTAGHVRTAVPASILAAHLPHPQRSTPSSDWPWMLRVLDAPAAIACRGFPTAVTGRLELQLVDDTRPDNTGPHVLEVDGGAGQLLRGGSGRVTISAPELAVLYSGGDVAAMRTAGLLGEATGDDLDLLAAAFVSRPTIPLFF